MHISFKLVCTLVVPVLLGNAYPQLTSIGRRAEHRNLNIQFHPTWLASGATPEHEVPYQVELEGRPRAEGVTDDFAAYNVVGGWKESTSDRLIPRVIATIAPNKELWKMMVMHVGDDGGILAGGYDEEPMPRWWIFSREIDGMKGDRGMEYEVEETH